MALLDRLSPRFAVAQSEAHAAIRRMVRVFFASPAWAGAEQQVDERFARKERYGSVTGESGRFDERPASLSWKPYETAPAILGVDVVSLQFGHHLVDIIAMERSVGRKVQPLPQGFRLERPLTVAAFESQLGEVLGHGVELAAHLRWTARMRLLLELLGGRGGTEAPEYHQWLRTLPSLTQARLRGAHDFIRSKRRGREMVGQMASDPVGFRYGLAGLLQDSGGLTPTAAAELATEMIARFPPDRDWQSGLYSPLRIPIESDWLEVDCAYPLGVRGGAPYVPDSRPLGPVELILQPDTSRPCPSGIYGRQCLILDAVDELRRGFGLAPDARYEHYRRQAMPEDVTA